MFGPNISKQVVLLESNMTLFMECIYQDGELRFNIHFWEHFGFYGMS